VSEPLVVTFGEAMLRLSAPRTQPLRLADSLSVHVGGAEANVAAGVASLGLRARWYSRVARGELGERVLGDLARHGVDTAFVARGEERTGLYFFEEGIGARPASVVYDRAGSAFTAVREEDAAAAVEGGLLDGAAAFVTSGITLALGDGPRAAAAHLWRRARAAGAVRVLDINYRSRLATPAEAAAQAAPLLASADIVVVAERDLCPLFGDLPGLRAAAGAARIVITQGAAGASTVLPDCTTVAQGALPSADEGRIGRGDAFLAGYLTAHLEGGDVREALAFGVASASLKSTQASDLPALERARVEALAEEALALAQPDTARAYEGSAPDVQR
jgi:2-dehydro-3-deoxygluconokinase